MSHLSFKIFCVESYSAYTQTPSDQVFRQFEREKLLALLDSDYEDLHGMGIEYLTRFCDSFLRRVPISTERRLLFHGSTFRVEQPEIRTNEVGRDFGFAFYVTDLQDQAERWAKRRAMLEKRAGNEDARPILNIYEWNEPASHSLNVQRFDGPSAEWLEMVLNCRRLEFCHGFDLVIGSIADDRVGETVSYVLQGIMRREDALERLRFEKINNQYAFCTPKSLETLRFHSARVVQERPNITHSTIRVVIIPEIVQKIASALNISEDEALKAFYTSEIGRLLADEETGLFGQSVNFITELFLKK